MQTHRQLSATLIINMELLPMYNFALYYNQFEIEVRSVMCFLCGCLTKVIPLEKELKHWLIFYFVFMPFEQERYFNKAHVTLDCERLYRKYTAQPKNLQKC